MIGANFSVRRTLLILGVIASITLYYIQDLISLYEVIVALREGTVDTRLMLQRRAWDLYRENQYLGVDYGRLASLSTYGHWLHNAYLVLIFGAGTFGAIPYFVFIVLAIARGIRTYFAKVSEEQAVVAGGLLAGVSVSLVEWLAYGQFFNYASWLGLTLLYLSPLYNGQSQKQGG
jgi:O-antigen ligase